MSVLSIWESYFPPEAAAQGRQLTEAIWRDMRGYDGYLDHELLQDLDDPGHLLVVSRWSSRERADAVLRDYADTPTAKAVNALVARPRRRFVARHLQPNP
jgi:quinol monooxygenase YgiN